MSRVQVVLMILAVAALPALADTWWYTYEADGTYPEEEGWSRIAMGGGAQRSFEDGALVLDSSAGTGICDSYSKGMPSLPDPNDPTSVFVCEWRLCVDWVDPFDKDPGVALMFEGFGEVNLKYTTDRICSAYEFEYIADFEPWVFHTYTLTTSTMQTYTLAIDGSVVWNGVMSPYGPASVVRFGDLVVGNPSRSRWDYVRYGVVSVLAGDVNCDGTVDFLDINPFVAALTVPADMPGCGVLNADINQDGVVDFADINPFVDLMLQAR